MGGRQNKARDAQGRRGVRVRRAGAGFLFAAAGAAIGLMPVHALGAPAAEIPVTGITLYRSGVGFFERQGRVDGDATVRLRFDAGQINDILKSMVILDRSGGRVAGVSYASNEPLDRRLGSFAIDLSRGAFMHEILEQVRGANIRLGVPDGDVTGRIIGVESRVQPVQGAQPVAAWHVNVLTSTGLRSIPIDQVRTFELLDEDLKGELDRALGVLASTRDERVRTVDVALQGRGERDVFIGYVHESPVWKTSYRLVLPEASEDEKLTLQGWAIVENTTDSDWRDVRLSLVSGSPVGFRMDLYEPLFVDRPMVAVPAASLMRPKSYAAGQAASSADEAVPERLMRQRVLPGAPRAAARGDFADGHENNQNRLTFDGRELAAAQATGGDVGEQFFYTLDQAITIERQQSAMVPILTGAIDGRRVSIYSGQDRTEHPMRGVQLDNETGLDLMPGPVSVFDGGAYAGDALLGHTPRGGQRLLSYAADMSVRGSVQDTGRNRVDRVRIVDGVLFRSIVNQSTTTYTFTSTDAARGRTIIVEHPVHNGWTQGEGPEPIEIVSPAMHRYEVRLDPKGEAQLRLMFERVESQRFAITDTDPGVLLTRFQEDRMPADVVAALTRAVELRAQVVDAQQALEQNQQQRREIEADQARLRENIRVVDRQSELHARYLSRMAEQETTLERLVREQSALATRVNERQAAFREYVRGLNAG